MGSPLKIIYHLEATPSQGLSFENNKEEALIQLFVLLWEIRSAPMASVSKHPSTKGGCL
jgi:hypothetical protein